MLRNYYIYDEIFKGVNSFVVSLLYEDKDKEEVIIVLNFKSYIEYFLLGLDVLLEMYKYSLNVIENIWVYYKFVIFFKDEVVNIEVILFNCSYKF